MRAIVIAAEAASETSWPEAAIVAVAIAAGAYIVGKLLS